MLGSTNISPIPSSFHHHFTRGLLEPRVVGTTGALSPVPLLTALGIHVCSLAYAMLPPVGYGTMNGI